MLVLCSRCRLLGVAPAVIPGAVAVWSMLRRSLRVVRPAIGPRGSLAVRSANEERGQADGGPYGLAAGCGRGEWRWGIPQACADRPRNTTAATTVIVVMITANPVSAAVMLTAAVAAPRPTTGTASPM